MNLKQFLQNKSSSVPITEETLFPVVLGVGSFAPFHTGYLPMIKAMISESEAYKCDMIMVVLENKNNDFAVEKLKQMVPAMRIMVRSDINEALADLSNFQRAPMKIFCEKQKGAVINHSYHELYPFSSVQIDTDSFLSSIDKKVVLTLQEGNFVRFHAMHIDCSLIESRNVFNSLRV